MAASVPPKDYTAQLKQETWKQLKSWFTAGIIVAGFVSIVGLGVWIQPADQFYITYTVFAFLQGAITVLGVLWFLAEYKTRPTQYLEGVAHQIYGMLMWVVALSVIPPLMFWGLPTPILWLKFLTLITLVQYALGFRWMSIRRGADGTDY